MLVMYLLRVVLPDRPGSLGALATALGAIEADIVSLDVIEHRPDGTAIDDLLVELPHGRMPDSVVSACQKLEGVRVQFLRRYPAGADLTRDLEAVEAMAEAPHKAEEVLVQLAPGVFRADWAMVLRRTPEGTAVEQVTDAGPEPDGLEVPWWPLARPRRLEDVSSWAPHWRDAEVAAAPLGDVERALLVGRAGGPEFLDSEVARLGHLTSLVGTITATGDVPSVSAITAAELPAPAE